MDLIKHNYVKIAHKHVHPVFLYQSVSHANHHQHWPLIKCVIKIVILHIHIIIIQHVQIYVQMVHI
jgi:hypothetical protein